MNVELLEDVESKTREDMKHVENVLRHINNVRRDCELLGKRLMENGEFQLSPFQIKYLKLEAKNRLNFWEKQLLKLTRKQYESWEKLWS